MTFPEKLRRFLEEIAAEQRLEQPIIEIQPGRIGQYVAIMISKSFEQIPEYVRQEWVWQKILDQFDDFEQRRVEFVHTMDPAEAWGEEEEPKTTPPKSRAKRRGMTKP